MWLMPAFHAPFHVGIPMNFIFVLVMLSTCAATLPMSSPPSIPLLSSSSTATASSSFSSSNSNSEPASRKNLKRTDNTKKSEPLVSQQAFWSPSIAIDFLDSHHTHSNSISDIDASIETHAPHTNAPGHDETPRTSRTFLSPGEARQRRKIEANFVAYLDSVRHIMEVSMDHDTRAQKNDTFTTAAVTATVVGTSSTFEIVFSGSFPPEGITALKEAMRLWADRWSSTVPVRISASWKSLGSILARAGSLYKVSGYSHPLLIDGVVYTSSMAASITGRQFIPFSNSYDIVAEFNSDVYWNYLIDSAPSSTQFDLITVALHELCHGLFFEGTISGSSAGVNFKENWIARFDTLLAVNLGGGVIESCNSSRQLESAVTSNSLIVVTSSGNLTLYAPFPYQSGSSIYHFDESSQILIEDCKRNGLVICSDLMTPQLPAGYVQRRIGDNTMAVLETMKNNNVGAVSEGSCEAVAIYRSSDITKGTNTYIYAALGIVAAGFLAGVAYISYRKVMAYSRDPQSPQQQHQQSVVPDITRPEPAVLI